MDNISLNNQYLIYNAGIAEEDLYILNETLVDVVEDKIIINISKLLVNDYWRRNVRYEVGLQKFTVSISPEIKLFKSMKDDEERYDYVKNNWKNLVRIAFSNIHKDYFEVIHTGYVKTVYSFEEINEDNKSKQDLCRFFKKHFPDLKFFRLLNGYTGENLGYIEIK